MRSAFEREDTYEEPPEEPEIRCSLTFSMGSGALSWDVEIPQALAHLNKILGRIEDAPEPVPYVRQAAIAYLALGFGTEARALLMLYDIEAPDLLEIARIVDGELIGPDAHFAHAHNCNSQAALWASLGQETLSTDADLNVDALVHALFDLSPPLRMAVGPLLVRRLENAGRPKLLERVEMLLESWRHTPTSADPATSTQDTDTPENAPVDAIADKPPEQGPEPHLSILEDLSTHIKNRTVAPESLREHAHAVLDSIYRKPERAALLRALVLADMVAGQMRKAIELIEHRKYVEDDAWNERFWRDFSAIATTDLGPTQTVLAALVLAENTPEDSALEADGLGARLAAFRLETLDLGPARAQLLERFLDGENTENPAAPPTGGGASYPSPYSPPQSTASHTERARYAEQQWIERDLDTYGRLADDGPRKALARNHTTAEPLSRPLDSDMPNARRALSESTRTRTLINDLLAPSGAE